MLTWLDWLPPRMWKWVGSSPTTMKTCPPGEGRAVGPIGLSPGGEQFVSLLGLNRSELQADGLIVSSPEHRDGTGAVVGVRDHLPVDNFVAAANRVHAAAEHRLNADADQAGGGVG